MSEKVFRVIDGFDCENKPCKLIENTITNEEYNTENGLEANSLCKLLNEKEERIKTLTEENEELRQDNDIKFWKLKCMHYFNANSVFMSEISRAMKKGYIISEHFQKFLDDVKEHNKEVKEKNKRLFGDSG